MPVFVVLCFVMYSGQIHSWTIMIKISLASFVIHEKNTISVGKSCKHLEFLFFTSKDILIWSIILAFYLSTEAPCNLFVFSFPRIFLSLSISPSFHFNVPMSTASWKKNQNRMSILDYAYVLWFLKKTYFSLPLPLPLHFLKVRLLKAQVISEKFKGICHFYCFWFYFLHYQEIQLFCVSFLFLFVISNLPPTHSLWVLPCLFLGTLLFFWCIIPLWKVSPLPFTHVILYLSVSY